MARVTALPSCGAKFREIGVRKVRAPQDGMLGNSQGGRPHRKCHRKYTARALRYLEFSGTEFSGTEFSGTEFSGLGFAGLGFAGKGEMVR